MVAASRLSWLEIFFNKHTQANIQIHKHCPCTVCMIMNSANDHWRRGEAGSCCCCWWWWAKIFMIAIRKIIIMSNFSFNLVICSAKQVIELLC